jgi:hypothetical protein
MPLTPDQIQAAKESRAANAAKETVSKEPRAKGEELAVNQQTAESTALSVAASQTAGSQLAVSEGKAFVVGYATTSKRIAATIETELEKLRNQRQAAIASVAVDTDLGDADFLLEFELDLSAAIAGI